AIFSKKPDEGKDEVKYEVATAAAGSSKVPTVKIPTILIQPRISEKSGHLASLNKYVFKVQRSTNKVEVKKAVEAAYKVHVTQVNIVNNQAKARNYGRTSGKMSPFKKAVVTLKKGEKIEGLTDVV